MTNLIMCSDVHVPGRWVAVRRSGKKWVLNRSQLWTTEQVSGRHRAVLVTLSGFRKLPHSCTEGICTTPSHVHPMSRHITSLVPRPYARAHERVWLHKSKSLGPLQNLKVSNEIAKWRLLE